MVMAEGDFGSLLPSGSAALVPSTGSELFTSHPSTSFVNPATALPLPNPPSCPGFCGRVQYNATAYSDCEACPWGHRSSSHLWCSPCNDTVQLYDWLYLLFVATLPFLLHCSHVHRFTPPTNPPWSQWAEFACCACECALAAIFSLLVFPPRGQLGLVGCGRSRLKQWYPWLYNPVLKFARTMSCTYEVVFPLYSLPFVYFLCCLINMVILRTVLYSTVLKRLRSPRSYYAALFTLPILALGNSFLSGILHVGFPYLVGMYSIAANAIHLACLKPISKGDMLKKISASSKNVAFLVVNSLLLAFAIISLGVRLHDAPISIPLLSLVPIPPLFFILTSTLTSPVAVRWPVQ